MGRAANVAAVPNVADNWPHLCAAFDAWGIASPLTMVGLIGTIAKESGSFYPVREAWWVYDKDPAAARRYYEDTRQHAAYGGGWWYHGRGYIQTTHLSGYQSVQDALSAEKGMVVDLVGNPDLLLTPEWASHAAAIFFRNKGLPALCEARNWVEVRRRVWGQYGDTDGVAKLQRAASVLA